MSDALSGKNGRRLDLDAGVALPESRHRTSVITG